MCTSSPTLSDLEDDINLRCWDQKRRFGIDFLYPIDRYTQALTQLNVPNRQGDLVHIPPMAVHSLRPVSDNAPIHCFCFAVGVADAGPVNYTEH